MKTVEVYKGFSIFEADGDYLKAGFKFQIDIAPGERFRYAGMVSIDDARRTIDWLAWNKGEKEDKVV